MALHFKNCYDRNVIFSISFKINMLQVRGKYQNDILAFQKLPLFLKRLRAKKPILLGFCCKSSDLTPILLLVRNIE